MTDTETITNKVLLKRVVLFFGNAVGNVAAAMVTAVVATFIMMIAEVDVFSILIWLAFLIFFVGVVLLIESKFDEDELTIDNAQSWLALRMTAGCLVTLMYSLLVYFFPADVESQFIMYVVMILIVIVAICATGFAVMPIYTYLISIVTAVPVLVFLIINASVFNLALIFLILVAWGVLIIKARQVSVTAIQVLALNEQLAAEINSHENTRQQLNHMVNHDHLTGLPNRKNVMEQVTALLAKRAQSTSQFALLFLDLDGFKEINDKSGHAAGDLVLKQVSKRLMNEMRDGQTVARIGGDEFIVLVPTANAVDADGIIDALIKKLSSELSQPMQLNDQQQATVGVSIGVIKANASHQSAEAIIQEADFAMYQNKKSKK